MSDLKIEKRKRASLKGWLRRSVSKIKELCSWDSFDEVSLQDELESLNSRFISLKLVQEAIESLIEEESELLADIENEAAFHDEVRGGRVLAKRMLAQNDTESLNSSQARQKAQVNLPKLNLPNFTGDYIKWVEFRDIFEASVHSREDLPNVAKFSYLLQLLKGEAVACVSVA